MQSTDSHQTVSARMRLMLFVRTVISVLLLISDHYSDLFEMENVNPQKVFHWLLSELSGTHDNEPLNEKEVSLKNAIRLLNNVIQNCEKVAMVQSKVSIFLNFLFGSDKRAPVTINISF